MFNPLSLRLCCLATMAPALTSEAATRARDKLPGSPVSPGSEVSLIGGRDCPLTSSSSTKGGGDSHFSFKTGPQLATISKELQRRLRERAQLAGSKDCGFQNLKQKQVSLITLTSLASISELYQKQHQQLSDKSSLQHSAPSNQLNSSITEGTMSTSKDKAVSSETVSPTLITTIVSNTNNGISQSSTLSQSKMTVRIDPDLSNEAKDLPIPKISSPIKSEPSESLPIVSKRNPTPSLDRTTLSNGFSSRSQLSKDEKKKTVPTLNQLPSSQQVLNKYTVPNHIPIELKKSNPLMSDVHATNQLLDSVARRHKFLETKTARLLKKLRRLQSRQAMSHSKQQLTSLIEQQQKISPSSGKSRNSEVDLKTELLQSQNAKGMSTAALVSLIHKWQCAQTSSLRQQLLSPSQNQSTSERLDEETCVDLDRVSGHLSSNLSHLQSGLDSDATESSSGGESGEEWDLDDDWDNTTSHPPIQCRAEWKWATDRASIATRWTWLQAQVSDLEYRIRQQYDIYKQIRANKGPVTLGETLPTEDFVANTEKLRHSPLIENLPVKNDTSPSSLSTLLSNVDKQAKLLRTQQLGPLYTPHQSPCSASSGSNIPTPKTPNGFIDKYDDSRIAVTSSTGAISVVTSKSTQGARCRPVQSYRKRKLLRTTGLYHVNRKAARLSTVQCHCYPPISPCAMCGGRYNNTVTMEPETMPFCEKIALIDVSYHPVLSFAQDVALSTHFESMLKTGEWQQKPPPRTLKVFPADHRRSTFSERVRKYTRKLKNKNASATILSSTKIRNKYDLKQLSRSQSSLMNCSLNGKIGGERSKLSKLNRAEVQVKKRKAALQNIENFEQKTLLDSFSTVKDDLSLGGQGLTPRESWLRRKRERGESAYDINNIVIPYSIASSTRVEKLQYKEILTPKWREVVDITPGCVDQLLQQTVKKTVHSDNCSGTPLQSSENPPPNMTNNLDMEEDLSDEVYHLRHIQCEMSEKKRFSTAVPLSAGISQRRSRGAQRSDSFASIPASESTQSSTLENTTVEEGSLVYRTCTPPLIIPSTNSTDEVGENGPLDSFPSSECTRTRTSSVSSSKSNRSRSASHSEERSNFLTTPWPKRTFPLNELDFDALHNHDASQKVNINHSVTSLKQDAARSQYGGSAEENIVNDDYTSDVLEEDPDDPEWTVISEKPLVNKQPNNIVLKLAKR